MFYVETKCVFPFTSLCKFHFEKKNDIIIGILISSYLCVTSVMIKFLMFLQGLLRKSNEMIFFISNYREFDLRLPERYIVKPVLSKHPREGPKLLLYI